jgi:hypothetical protein
MVIDTGLRALVLSGIDRLPQAEWDACFPGEAEGWVYLKACGGPVAAVMDADGLLLAAPLFEMEYRLDTPFQEGRAAAVARILSRLLPGLMVWRLLGVGSALTERCPVALRPGLSAERRLWAMMAFLDLLEREAARRRARLLAFKDVAAPEADWLSPLLAEAGYATINSLPVAALDLRGLGEEAAYLQRLSAGTRKDIRRKLKAASAQLRIEHRAEAGDLLPRIEALYESTRTQSSLHYGDFEELPAGYFRTVPAALGDRARFVLYWVGDRLAAFNLLLLGDDRVIDKFLGMEYPLARDHNIYAVSWMENVRFALRTGRHLLQSGQTAYASKLRFGSVLVPSAIHVHCRIGPLNGLLRRLAPWLAFDRWDPELRARAAEAGEAA